MKKILHRMMRRTCGRDTGGERDYINLIQGGAGAGDDIIDSGAGQDYVYAGAGNDIIIGGAGADILNGVDVGNGEDMLRWRARTGKINSCKSVNIEFIQSLVFEVQAWRIAA